MRYRAIPVIAVLLFCASCAKPMAYGHVVKPVRYFSDDYAANANDTYYAVRWALKNAGYPVDKEDLAGGVITTKWLPVKAGSHYVEVFGEPDYGVTGSYYQLDIRISPSGGRTLVKVGSRAKTLVVNLKSSGTEERKVLTYVGDYLRGDEPDITNLGIQE